MTSVRIPQAISLDTSLLAVWARDWTLGQPRALALVRSLLRSNARLLLTLHHLVELLGHGSDEVVAGRVAFVRSLEQAYWVKSRYDNNIGSVLDLVASEVSARSADPSASYGMILSRTRPEVLGFGQIGHIVSLLEAPEIIAYARDQVRRRRIVQSLLSTKVPEAGATEELVAPQQRLVPLTSLLSNFDWQEKHTASQLKDVGDAKLTGHAEDAKLFFDELRGHARAAARGGVVRLADVLREMGIEEGDLRGVTSVDMLAGKYIWKRRSEIIARTVGLAASTVERMRPRDLPSLYLAERIADCQGKARRASGGNPDDASLACLSLYVDLVTVDKRTAEFVRQARKNFAALDAVMGRVMPMASLETLEAEIRGETDNLALQRTLDGD
jgi:hypothetical protein